MSYYNYRTYYAASSWDRRTFLNAWWRINQHDPGWVPPYYPTLQRELNPAHNPHLARLNPIYLHLEAIQRREKASQDSINYTSAQPTAIPSPAIETPVAVALVLHDPRQPIPTLYMALPHLVNDLEPLGRLLDEISELAWQRGCRKVIAPTGISPHLKSGLLTDHWNRIPPLQTPYAPPFTPEIFNNYLHALTHTRLYHLSIPGEVPPRSREIAEIIPLQPERLSTDLLPLFDACCPQKKIFQPPDSEEAAFLIRWTGAWSQFGWLAQVDDIPVGFVLLQPDLSHLLRRYRGGRNLFWRSWLRLARKRPVSSGRLLFGGVLSDWRRKGIGTQLLEMAMRSARELNWKSLSIGPIPEDSLASFFLIHHHAAPLQSYTLYHREL